MKKTTFGLIVGNREFFSDSLVLEGRRRMIEKLESMGFEVITPSINDTKLGAVESLKDAEKCAKLFKENSEKIDGIVITLPNFGDEKAIAQTIRLSGLRVPVLVHAFSDDPEKLDLDSRRDSFCGKISVCNNLKQYGIKFSLTTFQTENPEDKVFEEDIKRFAGVCKVVKNLKNLKIGAVGARPSAFNTIRFSEKILEKIGVSVETIDLSEILYNMNRLTNEDNKVKQKEEELRSAFIIKSVPDKAIIQMAKLGVVLDHWMEENNIKALSIQCWTSIENNIGITPCSVMSLLSEHLKPAACEVDVMGALSMYILQSASGKPSALVDWNNNYREEDDVILFHCGNFPISIYENVEMKYADIIGTTVGLENAYGACAGKIKTSPFTFLRVSTIDEKGKIKAYVGEGIITDEDPKTFGSRGVAKIKNLQDLMKYICKNSFEHHVAINLSSIAVIIEEALKEYFDIEVYSHL